MCEGIVTRLKILSESLKKKKKHFEHTSFIKSDCSSLVVDKMSDAEFSVSVWVWFNATCISRQKKEEKREIKLIC